MPAEHPHSGLADPPTPEALRNLPAAPSVGKLHRLSEYPQPWWFATGDLDAAGGGRFDLPPPEGTCYLAETLDGALVEKLLRTGTKVVVAERLAELFHATIGVRSQPSTADLSSPAATGFGINHEIHATLDYQVTRGWAAAIRKAGWRAVRYLLRGDPSATASGRALFGSAGLHQRAPAGMRTKVRPIDRHEAERLLDARNVEVRPIPAAVPVTPASGY